MSNLEHIGTLIPRAIEELRMKNDALRFIKAGNATFTLESKKIGKVYTYKIVRNKNDKVKERLYVYRLYGPDNNKNYRYIGLMYTDNMRFNWTNLKLDKKLTIDQKMLEYFVKILTDESIVWPETCKFYKSGKCAVCGRKLTTPESVKIGIGPNCLEYVKGE